MAWHRAKEQAPRTHFDGAMLVPSSWSVGRPCESHVLRSVVLSVSICCFERPIIPLRLPKTNIRTKRKGCSLTRDVNRWPCVWDQQSKLLATDRRPGDGFGTSVSVDSSSGIIVIGSPRSRAVDEYNNDRSGFPFAVAEVTTPDGDSKPITAAPGGFRQRRAAVDEQLPGAAYIYRRDDEQRDGQGILISEPRWRVAETAKLQPTDKRRRGAFGTSTTASGHRVLVGAPSEPTLDVHVHGQGRFFSYHTAFSNVRWELKEYVVKEDVDGATDPDTVSLSIVRSGDLSETLTIGWATSDITAVGVSPGMAATCYSFAPQFRGECGDYIQTSVRLARS